RLPWRTSLRLNAPMGAHRITVDFIMADEAEDIRPSRTITLASYVAERQPLHPPHGIGQHRGVRWCWICGACCTDGRVKKLRAACPNLPSNHGREVLARVSEWPPLPPPRVQWPFKEGGRRASSSESFVLGELRPRGATTKRWIRPRAMPPRRS
ncbi:hypothetical protein N9L68_04660, partial [bacterium]|nr:hypothetical protein [bacterium]